MRKKGFTPWPKTNQTPSDSWEEVLKRDIEVFLGAYKVHIKEGKPMGNSATMTRDLIMIEVRSTIAKERQKVLEEVMEIINAEKLWLIAPSAGTMTQEAFYQARGWDSAVEKILRIKKKILALSKLSGKGKHEED